MRFFVYSKTSVTCSYHIAEAENMEALVKSLRANGVRWQLGKVFGHPRVALHRMPHKDAIMIAGDSCNFIAIEDARNAAALAYDDAEACWVMH